MEPICAQDWSSKAGTHRLLCACLAVEGPPGGSAALHRAFADPDVHWLMLLVLANEHLLGPALHDALADRRLLAAAPEAVRDYLTALRRQNVERNRTLQVQGAEVVAAFNRVGIEPVPLDATPDLLTASADDDPVGGRILTHLDFLVAPNEALLAQAVLRGQGYRVALEASSPSGGIDDFRRLGEVGGINLHRTVVSFAMRGETAGDGSLLSADEVRREGRVCRRDGLVMRVPRLEHRVLHRVLHDQVQEHGHYLGRLDLRHLLELSRLLASGGAGLDWASLLARMARHGLRTAFASHLLAAHDLFGAPLPPEPALGLWSRLHHRRRLWQWRSPVLAAASEIGGAAAWAFARCRYGRLPPGWRGEAVLFARRTRDLAGVVSRQPRRAFASLVSGLRLF
ncbi:MAG TPA: nucleotidyltransferase family protein [Azospirillaceae bacterium]|nr:nucleotidyltransferase family protein [Azospirillaceae bacterium]